MRSKNGERRERIAPAKVYYVIIWKSKQLWIFSSIPKISASTKENSRKNFRKKNVPNFFLFFFALCVFSLLLSGVATKAVMAASTASEAAAAQAEAEAAVAAFTLLSSSFSRL